MSHVTAPRPFVFVLMPFDQSFDDAYRLAIKPACDAAGGYAERVDEQIFQDSILQRIYNQIAKADLIVADLSGRNANVFYETGYAHALGKPVVLLTQAASDIPFDLRHYPHIIYEGKLSFLRDELERRVRHLLDSGQRAAAVSLVPVEVRINGTELDGIAAREIEVTSKDRAFGVSVTVTNPAVRLIKTLEFQVGIVTPARYAQVFAGSSVRTESIVAGASRVHLLRKPLSVLPGAWETVYFWGSRSNGAGDVVQGEPFAIRVFSEMGFFDFPFTMTVRRILEE